MTRTTDTWKTGLLAPDPDDAANALSDALQKRRQKLAETKIGLSPDSEDTQNG